MVEFIDKMNEKHETLTHERISFYGQVYTEPETVFWDGIVNGECSFTLNFRIQFDPSNRIRRIPMERMNAKT